MFIVIYCKITDDKKDGVVITKPIIGPSRKTEQEAAAVAKEIVNANRHYTVVTRIYIMDGLEDLSAILTDARQYFKMLHLNMIESKETMTRPIHRRRRRKHAMKTKTLEFD